MVRITNGDVTSRVPYSAYISLYRRIGFTIVDETQDAEKPKQNVDTTKPAPKKEPELEDEQETASQSDVPDVDDTSNEDEEFLKDILEKPLSQWSKDELQRFVKINEIDISGVTKTSEVRSLVKGYLDEIEKARAAAE